MSTENSHPATAVLECWFFLQVLLAEVAASKGLSRLSELPLFTYQHQLRVLHPAALSHGLSGFQSIRAAVHAHAARLPAAVAFATSDFCSVEGQSWSRLLHASARCSAILSSHAMPSGSCTAMQLPGPGIEAAVGLLTILSGSGSIMFLQPGAATAIQQKLPESVSTVINTCRDSACTNFSSTIKARHLPSLVIHAFIPTYLD